MPIIPLTIFRLRDRRGPLRQFVTRFASESPDVGEGPVFGGKFFAAPSGPREPAWAPALATVIPGVTARSQSAGGVLIFRQDGLVFALPFGTGHHLIEKSNVVRSWGRRIALNLLYDRDGRIRDPELLRKERSRRLSDGMTTSPQASRTSPSRNSASTVRATSFGP